MKKRKCESFIWSETIKLKTKFKNKDFDLYEIFEAHIILLPFYEKIVVMVARESEVRSFVYDTVASFLNEWECVPDELPF